MIDDGDQPNVGTMLAEDPEAVMLYAESRYSAFGKDLDYMWHWEVLRDGEFVQEGCSLSESSAREAVSHVIGFFECQDRSRDRRSTNVDAIKKLLREAGLGAPEVVRAPNVPQHGGSKI
jgi:methane monooxygenase component D